MYSIITAVLGLGALVAAVPSPVQKNVARTEHLVKRATCTPTSAQDASVDDVPAIEAAIKSCGSGGTIVIPAGIEYMIRSPLDFAGCVGCDFQIEGTLKASDDLDYWSTQSQIINMNGIKGAKIHSVTGTGVIDGNGQAAWDEFAVNSDLSRPTLHMIQGASSGISISNLKVKNPPNVFFSVKSASSSITYSSLTMSATSKSTNLPKNTDGFDISGSYVTISSVTVSNQDDCVAFKSGANYVTVTGITCTGSHGLSVGSLAGGAGSSDSVKNIYVSQATMQTSTKAVGIKLYPGGSSHGTATVSNVTFDGVTVSGCDYAAQIQSCYNEDASYCSSYPSTATLTDIYFKNFSGTTSSKYSPVLANINCPAAGTCDVYFSGWTAKPPSGTAKYLCANIDNSNPGITCSSGASG